ncbi:hypothetical protein HME9304_00906 [Flagellimonas maritima]|uniref:Uncharacterized protein n=1 Tax=Flagellimonas maritima TaxID=1383885 RepID=A0A2Z4LRE0_9FLAO|nr:hypothetical protein [Allomuricauda aurantiaca]AWX43908.1 hypothetical protein HME9304_00906 [Allomuricauda aurantiaca]
MKYNTFLLTAFFLVLAISLSSANETYVSMEDFDIDQVRFIEDEEDLGLGFDTSKYLPDGFNAYKGEFSLNAINFIDLCDEVELDFDTNGYLPEGFDPYIQ